MKMLINTIRRKIEKVCFLIEFETQTFKKQLIPLKVRKK